MWLRWALWDYLHHVEEEEEWEEGDGRGVDIPVDDASSPAATNSVKSKSFQYYRCMPELTIFNG